MSKPVQVLVMGWYGSGNAGDELILDTLHGWVKEKGGVLTVLSIDPAHTEKMHKLQAIQSSNMVTVAQAMQSCDLFVLGGGGLFQTHQAFSIPALYSYAEPDIAVYARPVLMARQFGVPTIMWAQGIGPLDNLDARLIVKDIFSDAAYVSVRDEKSKQLLSELGVTQKITLAPDPVWTLPSSPKTRMPEKSCLRVGIILRPWSSVDDWETNFVEALKSACPATDITLVWIPFQVDVEASQDGSEMHFVRKFMAHFDGAFQQELMELQGIKNIDRQLQTCDAFICMRMHAQILALKLGVPIFCIEYDPKMEEVSIQARVSSPQRLAINSSSDQWKQALAYWFKNLSCFASESSTAVRLLEVDAFAHRDVIHHAMEVTQKNPRSKDWKTGEFEWLKLWARQSDQNYLNAQENFKTLENNLLEANSALAERDHEISNLKSKIESITNSLANVEGDLLKRDDELVSLKAAVLTKTNKVQEIYDSNSWRITLPLRLLKAFFNSPKLQAFKALQFIYWRLPSQLQNILRMCRSRFRRWVKPLPSHQIQRTSPVGRQNTELNWIEFENTVLNGTRRYKGIFVQEATIDWNSPLYQRPQHIACALGRLGYLVIYKTFNIAYDNVVGMQEVVTNVWLCTCIEVDEIQGAVHSFYSTAYAISPDQIRETKASHRIVFEYIDHIDPQISGNSDNIRRLRELQIFAFDGGADFIVASAKKLAAEALATNPKNNVILVQNGVDTAHYRHPIHEHLALPQKLTAFKNKHANIVGYFGALAPWLWYEAIEQLAHSRPDLGFVFIGPDYYGGAEKLPKTSNVLQLGVVDYKILPAYAKQFDVCFIPFTPGEIAQTTSPLKLFEYFALEKPVVVTSDMTECIAFPEVFSGDSVGSLSRAIDSAILVKADASFKARLAQLADENDWDERAKAYEVVFQHTHT